jgi:hypothetical protein
LAVCEEGKGESASVFEEQGERGGEVERGGSWGMKRNWVTKMRGRYMFALKLNIY